MRTASSCTNKKEIPPPTPPTGLLLAGVALEQVESYLFRGFGVLKANLI